MGHHTSTIPRKQVVAAARALGVPHEALQVHIMKRKDIALPVLYSFGRSLGRYGVSFEEFWKRVRQ
jgi:hypothetical protein